LVVNQATSSINLLLNGTDGNLSVVANVTINISANLITGDSGTLIQIYNDTILWNNGSSPISNVSEFNNSATINFTAIYPGSQNYSANSETWWLHVTYPQPPGPDLKWLWNFRIIGTDFFPLRIREDGLVNVSSLHIRSNFTMFSDDGTVWGCGPNNSGSFVCT